MIFWIDAQLPPQLAQWLTVRFGVEAVPLRELGMRDAPDRAIFRAARDAAVSAEAANHGRIPPVQGEAAARLAVSIASRGEGGSVASHSGLRSVTARRVYSP